MTSANSMHKAGHPKLVLWDNLERQGEEGGQRFPDVGAYKYTMAYLC